MIKSVDEFILYDHVQYTKNDWRNRNKIKTKDGVKWLTIPVKYNYGQTISETVISYPDWSRKHWASIKHSYCKAKYFKEYENIFEALYFDISERHLSLINYQFIQLICSLLGISTRISWSTDYLLKEGKTERLVSLCQQVNATEYLTGPAAKAYLEEPLFQQANIKVTYVDYSGYPEYEQLFPPFEHSVSIIDVLFNEGPRTTQLMKDF